MELKTIFYFLYTLLLVGLSVGGLFNFYMDTDIIMLWAVQGSNTLNWYNDVVLKKFNPNGSDKFTDVVMITNVSTFWNETKLINGEIMKLLSPYNVKPTNLDLLKQSKMFYSNKCDSLIISYEYYSSDLNDKTPVIDYVQNTTLYKDKHLFVVGEKSLNNEVNRSISENFILLAVVVIILQLVTNYLLYPQFKLVGVFFMYMGLSVGGGIGLCLICGINLNALVQTFLFVIMGIGLDSLFVINSFIDNNDTSKIKRAIPALLMTYLTDIIAFGTNIFSSINIVKNMGIFVVVILVFIAITNLTIMMDLAIYLYKPTTTKVNMVSTRNISTRFSWSASMRHIEKNVSENKMLFVGSVISVIVFITSIFGMYGIFNDAIVKVDTSYVVPKNSYMLEFEHMNDICFEDSYKNIFNRITYLYSDNVTSIVNISKEISSNHPELFSTIWIDQPIEISYDNTMARYPLVLNPNYGMDMYKEIEKLNDQMDGDYIFKYFDIFYYRDSVLVKYILYQMLWCFLAVCGISMILLKHIVYSSILLFAMYLFCASLLFCIIYVCNIAITVVSYAVILGSIGIAVDFMIHVLHRVYHLEIERKQKMVDIINVLDTVGKAIFNSGMTTVLSVLIILFANTQMFVDFSIMMIVIIVLSMIIGLIIIPTILKFKNMLN